MSHASNPGFDTLCVRAIWHHWMFISLEPRTSRQGKGAAACVKSDTSDTLALVCLGIPGSLLAEHQKCGRGELCVLFQFSVLGVVLWGLVVYDFDLQ